EVFPEIHIGEHFEDHIDPASLRRLQDMIEVGGPVMIEDRLGAFTDKERAASLAPTRGDDLQPSPPCPLQCCDADAPGRTVDQHGLAAPCTRPVKEGKGSREI